MSMFGKMIIVSVSIFLLLFVGLLTVSLSGDSGSLAVREPNADRPVGNGRMGARNSSGTGSGFSAGLASVSDESPQSVEDLAYLVGGTVEYRGRGEFAVQTAGVLGIRKEKVGKEEVRYDYVLSSEVSPDAGEYGEILMPPFSMIRNPSTERFVGSSPMLRSMGLLSNDALDQMKQRVPLDGRPTMRTASFPGATSGFPRTLTYEITARRVRLRVGDAIVMRAISKPFFYRCPGTETPVEATHRVLTVMDATMDNLYFQLGTFESCLRGRREEGVLCVESCMHYLEGNAPMPLNDLGEEFNRDVSMLALSASPFIRKSDTYLPPWAMHSLAVHDEAALVAGAAMEGRPNFAITATIGLALLVDSGVSAGTTLLHEAGVIDWKWDGVFNYAGQGAGLAVAGGYEAATGKDVDNKLFQDIGGVAGDVAGMVFCASKAGTKILEKGAVFSIKGGAIGVKSTKNAISLSGKALRFSKNGVKIVDSGKGWINSGSIAKHLGRIGNVFGGIGGGVGIRDAVKDAKSRQERSAVSVEKPQPSSMSPPVVSATPSSGNFGVCLVLDTSASMKGSKLSAVRDATKEFLLMFPNGDHVGLVRFSDKASVLFPPSKMDSNRRHQAISLLPQMSANGGTNIEAGLLKGLDSVRKCSGQRPAVILLSDGKGSVGDSVRQFQKEGISVYTIAYGKHAAEKQLVEISSQTNGEFFRSGVDDIPSILHRIRGAIREESMVISQREIIAPKQTHRFPINVSPEDKELIVKVDWPGSHLTLTLRGPNGMEVSLACPPKGGEFVDNLVDSLSYCRIPSPAPGKWVVSVFADDVPETGEFYDIDVNVQDGMSCFLDMVSPRVRPGERAAVVLRVAKGVHVQKGSLVLEGLGEACEIPFSPEMPEQLSFLAPERAGLYIVRGVISGIRPDGSAFHRTIMTTLSVGDDDVIRKVAQGLWKKKGSYWASMGIVLLPIAAMFLVASVAVVFSLGKKKVF